MGYAPDGQVSVRPIVCRECGKVFEGERKDDPCPRCVAIDMLMPDPPRKARISTDGAEPYRAPSQADEAPPPVVIPGPVSNLANTLAETRPGAPPQEVERFAVAPFEGHAAAISYANDTMECPRCAEKIKIKAKMCRYCNLELTASPNPSPSQGTALARRSSSRFPALEIIPRRERVFRRLLRPAEMIRFQRGPAGQTSNIFLILAVVFGVVGLLVFPVIFGILAIICGALSCAMEGPQGLVGVLFGIGAIVAWMAYFGRF